MIYVGIYHLRWPLQITPPSVFLVLKWSTVHLLFVETGHELALQDDRVSKGETKPKTCFG